MTELPVIDLELGAKLLGSNTAAAIKMIQELIAILPENLQKLEQAYAADDIQKIEDIAHYIHGGSCYCGTPRLKAAAIALEKQAKAKKSLQEIEPSYEHLREEIRAVIHNDVIF